MEFPLNILPPEMIDLIADKLPVMDCLNAQKAFARDPEDAVNNIRNGLTVNLAKQSALYLLMDTDEYDVKYQYNYQLEGELPNALLPTLEGLPIASEASKMITLPELVKISRRRLKRTFPNVVELKVVLRDSSFSWLTYLATVVKAFSRQLTALQLLIFSDRFDLIPWKNFGLLRLFSFLNEAHFDCLQHFTLLFEDTEEKHIFPLDLEPLKLLSSETLKECYLRLPGQVIESQLKLLGENQGLERVGIIASYSEERQRQIGDIDSFNRKILTSPSLAAKIVHLMFQSGFRSKKVATSFFGWQIDLNRLEKFTSLRTLRVSLPTDEDYLTLMRKLSRLSGGSLTHLKIRLGFIPMRTLAFCRPLSQLAPCSPSVTHLKIEVESIITRRGAEGGRLKFSHLIFSHLSIPRHFSSLQQLEVVFPRFFSCSLCEISLANDGRECMEKAMQPFRAKDQLNLTFRQAQ